jgi:hypothetical protein
MNERASPKIANKRTRAEIRNWKSQTAAPGIKPRCARGARIQTAKKKTRNQTPRCARNQNERRAAREIKPRVKNQKYGLLGGYLSAVFRPGTNTGA